MQDISDPQYDPKSDFIQFRAINQCNDFDIRILQDWLWNKLLEKDQKILSADNKFNEIVNERAKLLISLWQQCNFIRTLVEQDVQQIYDCNTVHYFGGRSKIKYVINHGI